MTILSIILLLCSVVHLVVLVNCLFTSELFVELWCVCVGFLLFIAATVFQSRCLCSCIVLSMLLFSVASCRSVGFCLRILILSF